MKAAAKCKVGEPASTSQIRVCVWGQDPRKIFAEIGQAVGRTELSKLYVAGKLIVPGHQPIPDPGPRPERTRKLIKALLEKPLKNLSLNSDGYLIIPTKEEIARACPVSLNGDQDNQFESWRSEFPRDAPAPAVGTTEAVEANGNGVGNSPNIEPGSATPPLAPGTKADSEGDLKAKFGDEILCQKHLPDSGAQSVKSVALRGVTLCLTATPTAVGAQKTLRVWLHNKASQNASVPAGALIGQGGQGTFVSLVTQNIEDDKKDFAWRYTRITGFKKDNAELANGFMIFNKTGTPLEGHPKLVLLHEVEGELGNNLTLYGHAITRWGIQGLDYTKPDAGCVVA